MPTSWSLTLSAAALVLALAAASLRSADAATYQVGDTTGWQTPRASTNFYSAWASNKNFTVGDVLVFNFGTGSHDVATVTKDVYDNCQVGSATNVINNGPATIPLNSTGDLYFVCTFLNGNHCSQGQKLAITVAATPASSPSSPPSPPGTPATTPPPPSSASTVAATMFMSIVAAAFTCLF